VATLPASTRIIGDIHAGEDLSVAGKVQGNIHVADADLTIAEQGHVIGDIRARRIYVRGRVAGTVSANERIELAASASVSGHISADHVVVTEGAQVNAKIDMNRRTIAAMVARHKARS
jgi:cytoskeletal protein CcmA (bactofilin family)